MESQQVVDSVLVKRLTFIKLIILELQTVLNQVHASQRPMRVGFPKMILCGCVCVCVCVFVYVYVSAPKAINN